MPRVQPPAVTPKRRTRNNGRIIGQKRPLLPKQVWAIRARLELANNLRDLARERVSAIQSKTQRRIQFELSENTRDTIAAWI